MQWTACGSGKHQPTKSSEMQEKEVQISSCMPCQFLLPFRICPDLKRDGLRNRRINGWTLEESLLMIKEFIDAPKKGGSRD